MISKIFLALFISFSVNALSFKISDFSCEVIFPHSYVVEYNGGVSQLVRDFNLIGIRWTSVDKQNNGVYMRFYDFRPKKNGILLKEFLGEEKRKDIINSVKALKYYPSSSVVLDILSSYTMETSKRLLTNEEWTDFSKLVFNKDQLNSIRGESATFY